jgi:hypothetical protein
MVTICTTRFNVVKLCILPTQCISVFRMVFTIKSDCFPKEGIESLKSRVEVGSNTSTVALRVVGGDEKRTQCLGV